MAGLLGAGLRVLWPYWLSADRQRWPLAPGAGIRLPPDAEIHGVDASRHQGKINWFLLKETEMGQGRLHFAFIKATEGVSLRDSRFQFNFAAARRAGLYVGAYHFFVPWRDARRQAENFIRTVHLQSGDLPPVLDVETNALLPDADIRAAIRQWLGLVEAHYGLRPVIYTNRRFYRKFIAGHFDDYPLWLADYTSAPLRADRPVWFWQHAQHGRGRGLRGPLDYNIFSETEKQLRSLCIP